MKAAPAACIVVLRKLRSNASPDANAANLRDHVTSGSHHSGAVASVTVRVPDTHVVPYGMECRTTLRHWWVSEKPTAELIHHGDTTRKDPSSAGPHGR